ncbi:MAG TPA: heavy metal translocating P-type ATPase metal-binding domain-containing protein [Bacteroidia bacterium]|nr:heavy metal translocating P-type ATPase metal-binding domain-containing protein [Bacteroidia bacterium]
MVLADKTDHTQTLCFHCGDEVKHFEFSEDQKAFCCKGCLMVYQILHENSLQDYYHINDKAGSKPQSGQDHIYEILDQEEAASPYLLYKDDTLMRVKLKVPSIHCSSCVYLLENLSKIEPAIVSSESQFGSKTLLVNFKHNLLSFSKLAVLLHQLGYKPSFSFKDSEKAQTKISNKRYFFKLAVAFFVFGNIMLLSFPEYLGIQIEDENNHRSFFGYLSALLVVPSIVYSGSEFFKSAYTSLRNKQLHIDVPIAIGLIAMIIKSYWSLFFGEGHLYFDSLSGLIFFMLIGRMIQNYTYENISFNNDYRNYFPISATRLTDDGPESISLHQLNKGDRLYIRNEEIVPADAILMSNIAAVDYSFITGESRLQQIMGGEKIFAGAKISGAAIEVELINQVNNSHLSSLWRQSNSDDMAYHSTENIVNRVSRFFTPAVLIIAVSAFIFYHLMGNSIASDVFITVLIITCPCALALSAPFTYGIATFLLGQRGFYLKAPSVIEKLSQIRHIVFDKTGTLTLGSQQEVEWVGEELGSADRLLIEQTAHQSLHPLSKIISKHFVYSKETQKPDYFSEISSKGIEAHYNDKVIKLGSRDFVGFDDTVEDNAKASKVFVSINGSTVGYYSIRNAYRKGFLELINALKSQFKLSVISGDNESEQSYLREVFSYNSTIKFNQKPQDKRDYIQALNKMGEKTLMVGDGLNDGGALQEAFCGISVTDDTHLFSPSCDVILKGSAFSSLDQFLHFNRIVKQVLIASIILSLLYNVIGIYFALNGAISPLLAAILMPLSAVSVVLFSSVSVKTAFGLSVRHHNS